MKNFRGLWSYSANTFFVSLVVLLASCGSSGMKEKISVDTGMVSHQPQSPHELKVDKPKEEKKNYTVEELLGKIDPASDTAFVLVSTKYGSKSNMYLRRETYQDFLKMHDAAKKEGIELKIISATRTFNAQKSIWEAKWTGVRPAGGQNVSSKPEKERALIILRYSSMPGSSRHHWGTDIDLNNLSNSYFESGKGADIYQWMIKNAAEYGFYQPYTVKDSLRPTGYEEEKWHWSYKPISKPMLEAYNAAVTSEMISGFKGAETANSIDIISNYVNGINPECK